MVDSNARFQFCEWTQTFEFDKSFIAVEFGVRVPVGIGNICLGTEGFLEEDAVHIICQPALWIEIAHFEGRQGISVEKDEVIAQAQAWVGEAGVTPEGKLAIRASLCIVDP